MITMHDKLQIVYKQNKPYGIRDSNGFLLFFQEITKYNGQELRYREEILEQYKLAEYIICALHERKQIEKNI